MRSFFVTGCLLGIALGISSPVAAAEPQELDAAVIADLRTKLASKNRGVRSNAIRALGNYGTAAKAVVDDLAAIVREDRDEALAHQAALALALIGPAAVVGRPCTGQHARPSRVWLLRQYFRWGTAALS